MRALRAEKTKNQHPKRQNNYENKQPTRQNAQRISTRFIHHLRSRTCHHPPAAPHPLRLMHPASTEEGVSKQTAAQKSLKNFWAAVFI